MDHEYSINPKWQACIQFHMYLSHMCGCLGYFSVQKLVITYMIYVNVNGHLFKTFKSFYSYGYFVCMHI